MLSFAARFCALNGISIESFEDFIGVGCLDIPRLADEDITRIAGLLNEDFEVVRSVFHRDVIASDCSDLGQIFSEERPDRFRYCQRCMELGYQSYLPELPWLARCPIHLLTFTTNTYSSPKGKQRKREAVDKFSKLLRTNCRGWPRLCPLDDKSNELKDNGYIRLLLAWADNASKSIKARRRSQIWASEACGFFEVSYENSLSRLSHLDKRPDPLDHLLGPSQKHWDIAYRRFSLEVKDELTRVLSRTRFSLVFEFFKTLAAQSANPPPFMSRLRLAQSQLMENHTACWTTWAFDAAPWGSRWVKVNPDGQPHYGLRCPHEVAFDDLEVRWALGERVLSSKALGKQWLHNLAVNSALYDAGLVRHTPISGPMPAYHLGEFIGGLDNCEWNHDSPLTELLNAAAEFEIEAALMRHWRWLSDMEGGTSPSTRELPSYPVQLNETSTGLELIRWAIVPADAALTGQVD